MNDRLDGRVDRACSLLREVLLETRGIGRRAFLPILGKAAAGSVLLSPLSEYPVTPAKLHALIAAMRP